MRRSERGISLEESVQLLEVAEYGVLSMSGLQQEGYGIPLNFVFDGQVLYFHGAQIGKKIDIIRSNNRVSFCVVGKTEVIPSKFGTLYNSVIVHGQISESEGAEKQAALELFIRKYSSDFHTEGLDYIAKLYDKVAVLKLSNIEMSGKARKA